MNFKNSINGSIKGKTILRIAERIKIKNKKKIVFLILFLPKINKKENFLIFVKSDEVLASIVTLEEIKYLYAKT